jgi:hypothetical protein
MCDFYTVFLNKIQLTKKNFIQLIGQRYHINHWATDIAG